MNGKIILKSKKEIEIMQEGGGKLGNTLNKLIQSIKVGTNLLDVEKKARQMLMDTGGEPGFARVPNYKWATCLNVNEGIVHGVPKDYSLKEGDVLSIDIGLFYKGFNSDMCATILVEAPNNKHPASPAGGQITNKKEIDEFLDTGKRALREAIKEAKPGNRVGHISKKIEDIIEGNGYSSARNLTGHGIGRKLHEDPSIPCFLGKRIENTLKLKSGTTIAIEVIYAQGEPDLEVSQKDGWTIETKDKKLSGMFEQSVAVTKRGVEILTPLPLLSG